MRVTPVTSLQKAFACRCPCRCRNFSATSRTSQPSIAYVPISRLSNTDISTFRKNYFEAEQPVLLPKSTFGTLPACDRWFVQQNERSSVHPRELNYSYLEQFSECVVPLELTPKIHVNLNLADVERGDQENDNTFRRFSAPLSLFLEWTRAHHSHRFILYLAQCKLSELPKAFCQDVPTPDLVMQTGRGDIYDTNLWMGIPPTYTPLHRDPNPNMFVQLSGTKQVRMYPPEVGMRLFSRVRMDLGQGASCEAAAFRGDEMMHGQEKLLLKQAVWDEERDLDFTAYPSSGYEAVLEAGDGLFIPKGWWHSIQGVGRDIVASV